MVSPLTKYLGLFSQLSYIGPYFGLFVQACFPSIQLHLIQVVQYIYISELSLSSDPFQGH